MALCEVIDMRNRRVIAACFRGYRKARSRPPSMRAAVQTVSSSSNELTNAVVSSSSISGRAGGEAFTSFGHSGTVAIGNTVTFASCSATSATCFSTTDRSRYIEQVILRSDGSATYLRPTSVRPHRSSLRRRALDRRSMIGKPRWHRSQRACASSKQLERRTVG